MAADPWGLRHLGTCPRGLLAPRYDTWVRIQAEWANCYDPAGAPFMSSLLDRSKFPIRNLHFATAAYMKNLDGIGYAYIPLLVCGFS
jgi:hypothetical protein